MKVNFEQHNMSLRAKYICSCGHKFTRENKTYFTLNPFNPLKTIKDNKDNCHSRLKNQKRNCPKCQTEISPIN